MWPKGVRFRGFGVQGLGWHLELLDLGLRSQVQGRLRFCGGFRTAQRSLVGL